MWELSRLQSCSNTLVDQRHFPLLLEIMLSWISWGIWQEIMALTITPLRLLNMGEITYMQSLFYASSLRRGYTLNIYCIILQEFSG